MSSINTFSNICDIWSKFDLESVKKELEDKVIVIAKQLEEGDESRKRLIEQTKDFKKNLNEDQRKLVGPIMKSFQGEVDGSYKRSKLMEQVLLKLYKKLIELPDPAAALESSQRQQKKLDRIYELEIENKQLKEKLDEYETEFNQVRNQEVTIKSLKEKIKEHEEKLEQTLQQKLKEREKELERAYAFKDEQLQAGQLDLSKKSAEIEARCAHLQAQLHSAHTDLYDFKSKQDELMNAKTCEIDLLMQDLDKLTDRAVNAERLAEQYAKQLSIKSHEASEKLLNEQLSADVETNLSNDQQKAAYEVELAAKEKEIAQLLDDINKLHIKSNKAKEFHENQRKQLEEKLVSRERTLEQLEYDLKLRHDYEEIKRELNTLKLIEFSSSTSTIENNSQSTNSQGDSLEMNVNNSVDQKPLEILLLEKNRHLTNENTQVKNKLNELQSDFDRIRLEQEHLQNTSDEQKKLIVELENNLLRFTKQATQVETIDETIESLSTTEQRSGDEQVNMSLFNIVSSQRERFRARLNEMEIELNANKQQITFLNNELDKLRSDNVELYRKINFLRSNSKANINELDASSNVLNKYTNEYEKSLDPFTKFNYQEKQKRYSNLKLHDKFTLNIGRFIISSKWARLFFFAYFFIVHLLIFLSLQHMARHDDSYRELSAKCAESYRNHMQQIHQVSGFNLNDKHDHIKH